MFGILEFIGLRVPTGAPGTRRGVFEEVICCTGVVAARLRAASVPVFHFVVFGFSPNSFRDVISGNELGDAGEPSRAEGRDIEQHGVGDASFVDMFIVGSSGPLGRLQVIEVVEFVGEDVPREASKDKCPVEADCGASVMRYVSQAFAVELLDVNISNFEPRQRRWGFSTHVYRFSRM